MTASCAPFSERSIKLRLTIASGDTIKVTAPAVQRTVAAALKTLLRTIDGRYQAIDVTIPTVRKGFGVAATLADITASGTSDPVERIQRELDAVDAQVEAEIRKAAALVAKADTFAALLRCAADHIENGSALKFIEADPSLAESAETLRRAKMLGDSNGLATQTANILRAEADAAAACVANAAVDLRRFRSALKAASLSNRAKAIKQAAENAKNPAAVISEKRVTQLEAKAFADNLAADAYKTAYAKTFLKRDARQRLPRLKCIGPERLFRNSAGEVKVI